MKRKSRKRKNPAFYVAKDTPIKPAPREELVKLAKQILKEKQYKYIRKHVKKISIISTVQRGSYKGGEWDPVRETVKIYDDHGHGMEMYEDVIRHEFAHGEFHYLAKWNPQAHSEFLQIAEKHGPVSYYTKKHERMMRNSTLNVDFWSLYADEQHSELALILAGKQVNYKPYLKPSEELVQAYRRLHFLD